MPQHKNPTPAVLLTIFTTIIILACATLGANQQGNNWVIFSEKQSESIGIADWFADPGQATDYWTPTEEQVKTIQDGLASFLQENFNQFHASGTPVWERLDEYKSQYFGILIDNQHIIYANYFCTDTGADWQTDLVLVSDGGQCFFQFKYDADKGEFFDLQVNGDA